MAQKDPQPEASTPVNAPVDKPQAKPQPVTEEHRPTIIFENTLEPEDASQHTLFKSATPLITPAEIKPKEQPHLIEPNVDNHKTEVEVPLASVSPLIEAKPLDGHHYKNGHQALQMPNVVLPAAKPPVIPAIKEPERVIANDLVPENDSSDQDTVNEEPTVAQPIGNESETSIANEVPAIKAAINGTHNVNGSYQNGNSARQTVQPIVPEVQPAPAITMPTQAKVIADTAFTARPLNTIPPKNEVADREAIDAILNSLTDIIFEFDEQKICLNVWYNKTRALLVDLSTFKGKTISESIGEEKAFELEKALDQAIQTHECVTVEFGSLFGSGRWFSAKVSPVFNAHGDYTGRMTASVTDISEQKKYSAALKENQNQLIEAQRMAKMGNWWYDLELKQTYWSDNLFALLDINALPVGVSHFEYYARLVNAEDRRTIYQFFADLTEMANRETEHRIVTAKGAQRYFQIVRGEPIRNRHGKIVRLTGIIKDVTESRQSERAIKKSRAELLEAQTIAKIGNWKWYFNQKTLTWSDEVYHIHEVPPRKQKDHGMGNFKLLLTYVHPEDQDILRAFLKDPANLKRASYEYRIITPNHTVKHLSIIIGRIKRNEDGSIRSVIGTLQDITDRKAAEIIVQKTEDNYKLVLEAVKLAAISLDKNGNILFCNKYLANLLGYTQESLIGQNWIRHFVPDDAKKVIRGWYENDNLESTYVNPIICRNGEQRLIAWQNSVIYDDLGRIKQTTSIGEDITDKQKDRQQLIDAKEEAEKASSFKSDFLSTMSHEIRTPMNTVIGTANLLIADNPRPEQLPYLENLKFSGETLLGIINDILDYNKIEAGMYNLHMVPVDLHLLLENISRSFRVRADQKDLKLNLSVDRSIPDAIMADPVRLGQIMNNLIGNAVKFTNTGSVDVGVKQEQRTNNSVTLRFTVTDTGTGIAKENLEKIFEPFVQEMKVDQNGGSGLGLAIVKRLIELHGGRISISSVVGKGTQISFAIQYAYEPNTTKRPAVAQAATPQTAKPAAHVPVTVQAELPVKETTNPASKSESLQATAPIQASKPEPSVQPAATVQPTTPGYASAEQKMMNADLNGMKVLVVDDNKMNILIANRFLNKWNVKTFEASNGAIAVEMADQQQFDLIIMDLQMPVMDGFEATQLIKQKYPQIPVIALTADAMPETYQKASSMGMNDFLTKPFMPEILFEKVSKFYKAGVTV
ncbi:PAS domain S-box protein [Mucilaginibacter yixingensis]|uniref:PAS domain-containing hybrid sensor histidine kinase/response regulator n=1 Tax=Mucilaginibacter yixingensis TaxID=1295612 RepID=UPI001472B2BE|nr:PAS domain S-box protein [Mucilaginibacter yixingensis]